MSNTFFNGAACGRGHTEAHHEATRAGRFVTYDRESLDIRAYLGQQFMCQEIVLHVIGPFAVASLFSTRDSLQHVGRHSPQLAQLPNLRMANDGVASRVHEQYIVFWQSGGSRRMDDLRSGLRA